MLRSVYLFVVLSTLLEVPVFCNYSVSNSNLKMAKNVKGAPKKRTNGYKMPDPLPAGEILEDISKKKWKLGPSIGKGGFGEIYSAQEVDESKKRNNQYPYVIKIEPHSNGPLFVEMHFLLRNCKNDDVEAFKTKKKLPILGIPVYIGSGSYEHNSDKYRFVVIEKFGSDIWKLFLENEKKFPPVTVFKIGAQIVDVLEYIHGRGYVHHDIKGANILLDLKSKNQVYLVDFGLTGHYFTGKEFKPDPKKAHDGTLEYVSRDGHSGLQTRRGDLEILGFNLIQWLGCTLPWENLKNPAAVQKSKETYMNDIPEFMKVCFADRNPPKTIIEYFIYLNTLKFDTAPDYKKVLKVLHNGIDSEGGTVKSPLVFKITKNLQKRKSVSETPCSGKKPRLPRRKLDVNSENEEVRRSPDSDEDLSKKKPPHKKKIRLDEEHPVDETPKLPTKNKDDENITNGYTAEMKRIKAIMDGKKTKGKKAKSKLKTQAKAGMSKQALLKKNKPEIISDGSENEDSEDEPEPVATKKKKPKALATITDEPQPSTSHDVGLRRGRSANKPHVKYNPTFESDEDVIESDSDTCYPPPKGGKYKRRP